MVSSYYVWYLLCILVSVLTKLTYISRASSYYSISLRCVVKLIEILFFMFLVVCLSGLFKLHFFELCLPPLFDINNRNGPALSEWESIRHSRYASFPPVVRTTEQWESNGMCCSLKRGKNCCNCLCNRCAERLQQTQIITSALLVCLNSVSVLVDLVSGVLGIMCA